MRALILPALRLAVALAIVSFAPSTSATQAPRTLVFEGARLITGDRRPPIDNASFLVDNGTITRVGRVGDPAFPSSAARVDLKGKTVIPGLIDAHAHLGYQRYADWSDQKQNYTRDNLLDHLNRASFFGLSAIYTAGGDFGDLWYALRDEIVSGRHPTAARWIPSGPGLVSAATGRDETVREDAYRLATPADARRAVRELAGHGVRVLKAWVESRPGRGQGMAPSVYRAFIEEAHAHQMRTYVHAHVLDEAKGLLRAGNDGFAHKIDYPGPPDREVLDMLKERGTRVYMTFTQTSQPGAEAARLATPDPLVRETIAPVFLKRLHDGVEPQSPEALAHATKAWEELRTMTRLFLETGIRIGVGTDTSRLLPDRMTGWGMHVEMEELVASGMTPAEVLVAGTKTNAEWLGLDDLGTIASGKTATFVVLDADPLEDIKNTRRIADVYVRGVRLDRNTLARAWALARIAPH